MKIYFAGSITGGREDAGLYGEIIKILQEYGTVLTEHIGSVKLTNTGEKLSSEQICVRDLAWVNEADALVAEVTTASMGVGYEIGYAEARNKKTICLYREIEGKRISAMICGNKNLKVFKYTDLKDLKPVFEEHLK
jgi:2'-deoxynucleoside 5'-phosphate N-hydrolase